jgi:hypothetical protein
LKIRKLKNELKAFGDFELVSTILLMIWLMRLSMLYFEELLIDKPKLPSSDPYNDNINRIFYYLTNVTSVLLIQSTFFASWELNLFRQSKTKLFD